MRTLKGRKRGMGKGVRIGAIENSGPNTLVAFLRNAGAGCDQIDIAVAFITAAGLGALLFLLKKAASRGRVRVLTGLYQGFTEPKALWTLLREQEQTDGRLSVRVSKDGHFHWKAYMLAKKATVKVVVGSSNLTDDGLHQTGELNVVLSLGTSSKEFAELRRVFERHWQGKSEALTGEIVANYEGWRKETGVILKHRSVPIRRILGGTPRKRRAEREKLRYWRTCIDGHLEDETVDLLKQTTDWDRRGYEFFSTWRPTFRPGDRVILFDLSDKYLGVIESKDTTQTPVRTPDGFHFAAYRRVRGFARRRLVPNRWKALKAAGLLKRKDDAYVTRKLSKERFDLYLEQLKKS
jgi:HKD family nuclease